MADLQTIKLLVNTPDRVFYHDDATFVELSTSEGDIGVYPGHIPLTAVVVPCVLSIHNGNDVKKAAVHGGIIEILKDKITILAEVADEIDVERANEARLRAEKRLASHDSNLDMVRAETALKRSLARIKAVN
jgi:F-type H+-transporting ATPase subunit epsilon